ncbi:hypothetical protein niasHT_023550 [Heterodera trifolii]|uniref:Uncharacterized protein n=1 Tax=Heterodera trifolii TaxID=157864 RepID=A0ABD2JEQ8_9BILA
MVAPIKLIQFIIHFQVLSFFRCANSSPGAPPVPATIVASTTPSVPEGMPSATTATATALNGANAAENGVENAAAPATYDLAKLNIAELIPELRTALRPHFSSVHCDLSACPSLNQAPFNLPVQGLGQLICIVPDTVSSEEAAKQFGGAAVLGTCNGFHIVTDGKSPHQVLRLMLSGPTTARSGASAGTPDWRQPIRQFFNARLGDDSWALVSACRGAIGLLKTESASESSKSVAAAGGEQPQKNVMVWLAPISRRITVASGKKTVKKKVVRKVVRKSSNKSDSPEKNGSPAPEEAPPQSPTVTATTTTNGTMPTAGAKTTVGNNTQSGTGAKSVSAIIAGRMASLFNNCAGNGVEIAANAENGTGTDRNDAAPATTGDGDGETVREISVARFGGDESTAQSDGEAAGNNAKREEAAGNNAKKGEAAGNNAKREESSDTASKQSNGPIVAVSGTSVAVEHRSASKMVPKSGTAVEIKPAKADQLESEPKTDHSVGGPPSTIDSRRVGAVSGRSAESPAESVPEHSSAIKERRSQSLDGHELANGTANGVVGTLRMTESSSDERASFQARRPSGATFGQTRAGSSPSSPTGGSESPCSFLSATSGTTSETLINTTSRRFRREDAPSPSLNLVTAAAAANGTALQQQQQLASSATTTTPRRSSASLTNGTSAAGLVGTTNCCGGVVGGSGRLIMNGGYQHQLNVLSPISSCGSVSEETERDFRSARDEITSTTITNAAGDEEEEEDQTLMLLSHRRRSGSAERSLTGIEMDEVSMRDDFSMMSTVSSQAPQRPTRTLTTIAGSGTMSASVPGAAGRFHSSTVSATRMDEAPISSGTRGFSSSSRWSGRRRSSPSPSQKGSRTALDGLAASSAAQSPQFVSGMVSWRMPVTVLLQTLGLLSYKELSDLRRVHPHWDELCGQLLNQGYYQLIGRAQWLLTESQRKLNREPRLAQPIQLLTRLHVHVLNPDIVISCAEQINYDEASDQLDQLQDLARRANIHYRQVIEPEAEKRMSEMYRLSAQQRLQRLDSFLVESSMSRVERESEKARNDMRWELEQLKDQNAQLKKENRELKHLCVRLDGRVDVLERKFKTMARLLQ